MEFNMLFCNGREMFSKKISLREFNQKLQREKSNCENFGFPAAAATATAVHKEFQSDSSQE